MKARGTSVLGILILTGAAATAAAQGAPAIQWMRGGHSADISRLVYSSDGTFFVSGSLDNTIKIWRTSDNMLLRTLVLAGGTRAIAVSPDSAAVCAGGFDASSLAIVRCWHASDGTELWSAAVPGVSPGEYVGHLAFSPDGARLAAGAGNKLPIFDATDGSVITDFSRSGELYPPYFGGAFAYSPDGSFLAVNAGERTGNTRLALLDSVTGALAYDTADGNSVGYDAAFSPDSQLVGSVNGIGLHVFNTYAHTPHPFDTGSPSTAVAFSPSGARVATNWAGAGWINLFNVSTGSLMKQWNAHVTVGEQLSLTFSPDATKLLSGVFDIRRWKASDGTLDAVVTEQVGPAWLLALSPDEKVVAVATGNSSVGTTAEHMISLYRAADGALLRYIDYGSGGGLRGLAISPDGHHVAASDGQNLRVWNVDTGTLERTTSYPAGGGPYGSSSWRPLAYTPDGTEIAAGGDLESIISLWNPTTGTLTPLVAGPATVLRFLPAPDGRLVIANQISPVSYGSVVRIVTLAGHVDRELSGLQSVGALAVSPDGKTIAAGGLDGAFTPYFVTRLWRVSDGATLQTLVGHTNTVRGIAFAWDSQTVITGSADQTLRVWRASDATQLRLYDAETGVTGPVGLDGVWAVAASTRSARFLYGRGDATLVDSINPDAEPLIQTFTVPTDVTGCKTASAKVVLDRPAPPAGVTIALASSDPSASVPSSLVFKGGVSSKSFKISTSPVPALQSSTISATLDGDTEARTLGLRPIGLASITLTPNPATGGTTVNGSVTLECDAQPGGIFVTLSSSNPSVAQPSGGGVLIAQGTNSSPFSVTTTAVASTKKPTITAVTVPDAVSKSKKLVINP